MIGDLKKELEQLGSLRRLKEYLPGRNRRGGRLQVGDRELIDFSSWDFLGVNQNRKVKRAAQAIIEESGISPQSTLFSGGSTPVHLACESRIAEFLGTGSALLFPSKNQALLTLVTSLLTEQDLLITDSRTQSPVADAAYLVNARVQTYQAEDLSSLEAELEQAGTHGRRFVFVESISPLTGELLDLQGISEMVAKHSAELIVDESYALAALGPRGAGASEVFQLGPKCLCILGDMGRGLASYGAFIAGSDILVSYLLNRSSNLLSELPLPPAMAASVEAAIDYVELEPTLREKLRLNKQKFREGLQTAGFIGIEQSDSPVVALKLKSRRMATEMAQALFKRGYLTEGLPLGALLQEGGVVRFVLSAHHTPQDIDGALQAVFQLHSRMGEAQN